MSGGDPLLRESREVIAQLVSEVRNKYPKKSIWCYTGFTWEQLLEQKKNDKDLEKILHNIDVLLDGKFILRLAQQELHYVGSSNQCIIDVQKSLQKDKKVLYLEQENEAL